MRQNTNQLGPFPMKSKPVRTIFSALLGQLPIVLFVILIGWSGIAFGQDSLKLDTFSKTLKPGKLPEGWEAKKFAPVMGSGKDYHFQFVHDSADKHYLHVRSGANNSFSVGAVKEIQLTDWPVLAWDWKITQTPKGGDVRQKKKDDQAGAMCIVIAPSTFGFDSILCYIFENDGPKETVLTSTKEPTAKYLILRTAKTDKTGEWYQERRNVLADYKKAFGKTPSKAGVIGVQIDSNDTESSGEAFYKNIELFKK